MPPGLKHRKDLHWVATSESLVTPFMTDDENTIEMTSKDMLILKIKITADLQKEDGLNF